MGRSAAAVISCCAVLAWTRPGLAANEAHVRTPVLWPSECGRVVDRSVDPIAHFDYTIPVEDTMPTADELPDSRRHQFVALCRQRPRSELLPPWITRDDVDRSVAFGLLEAEQVTYREILDEATTWTDCFVRVTADDERRPISFAQAQAGVDWDTTTTTIGVWSLAGYTFEPALNLWSDRPGFVKILDDASDPEQDLPAIALLGAEQVVAPGATIELEACIDVLGPGTVELEWATFAPTLDWRPLDQIDVEEDGALALDVRAPIAAADSQILVRARLLDALGREHVGHAPARVSVLPCPNDGPECIDPPPPAGDNDQLGGCSLAPDPREDLAPSGLLILLVLLARSRRARD